MNYLSNAFSLQMLRRNEEQKFSVRSVDLPAIIHKVPHTSIVGHADTAAVFSRLLGIDVAHNRESVTLQPGDRLYVGQISGGRLPEGATTLPENFEISWLCLSVEQGEEEDFFTPEEKARAKEKIKNHPFSGFGW